MQPTHTTMNDACVREDAAYCTCGGPANALYFRVRTKRKREKAQSISVRKLGGTAEVSSIALKTSS